MKKEFYKILDFPSSDTKNGVLTMFQFTGKEGAKELPFQPKKVLVIKDMKGNDLRGGHTHHVTKQILIPLKGSCIVDLDNGTEKTSVTLSKDNQGLLLLPYVWHVMRDFDESTVLLVIADTEYDEKEYIRNYDDFLKFIAEKKPW